MREDAAVEGVGAVGEGNSGKFTGARV